MRIFPQTLFAAILLLVGLGATARAQDYLTDEVIFHAAWTKLSEQMQDADLLSVRITPTRIEVRARAAAGGPRVDDWSVERAKGLFGQRDAISGPREMPSAGPVGDIETGFFAASEFQIGALFETLGQSVALVPLLDPGGITEVAVARRVSLIPNPTYAELRWRIVVGNAREHGVVEALADGAVLGVNIDSTVRGRTRDMLNQADWPFADAEAGFRNIVGDAPVVYEVLVSRRGVSVTAVDPENPRHTMQYNWDGGRFTQGFVSSLNSQLILPQGDQAFALSDARIPMVPAIIAAARAAAPQGWSAIRRMEAIKKPAAVGETEVLWNVTLTRGSILGKSDEDALIRLRPDGTVVSQVLPLSLRPSIDYIAPAGMVAAIADLHAALGAEAGIFEIMFLPDRVTANGTDADEPRKLADFRLTGKGLSRGMGRPVMFETEADLILLNRLASLDAATLTAMQERAVAEMGGGGAEVWRLKIWSGTPFWTSRDGMPFVDIRVRGPRVDGYVVFTLDGRHVETVR